MQSETAGACKLAFRSLTSMCIGRLCHHFRQNALKEIIPLMEADEKNLKVLQGFGKPSPYNCNSMF